MATAAEGMEPVNLPRPVVSVRRVRAAWVLAALVMGAVSALSAAGVRVFFNHLQWLFTGSTAAPPIAGAHLPPWRRAVVPMAGALLAMGVLWVQRWRAQRLRHEPGPYVEYVEAVRHRGGEIPVAPNGWRTFSAAFSIASGAAVGREGSMIQFAAAIASLLGKKLQRVFGAKEPLDLLDLRLLVAFGVAGGVTAAYNAPVAAIFFAAEIVLGAVQWRELPLLALAASAARLATGPILGWERLYPTQVAALREQGWWLLLLPLLAVLFGFVGPLYQRLIRSLQVARKLPLPLLWGGLVVGLLSMHDPRVWGNGDLGLSAALGRAELPGLSIAAPALAMLLGMRLLATSACVGTGTVGGVFTPTLFAGGAAGALLGHGVWHLGHGGAGAATINAGINAGMNAGMNAGTNAASNAALWAIVGMSCLMAAVTHAPLMAAFIAVELTGEWRLVPGLLVLNLISRYVARRLSPEALYAIASQDPDRAHAATNAM